MDSLSDKQIEMLIYLCYKEIAGNVRNRIHIEPILDYLRKIEVRETDKKE